MAASTGNQRFVDEITQEIIGPGVDRLMESRYFTDLRAGVLTTRQLGGFAIQHYIHNMAVLKGFALVAVQRAADDRAFMAMAGGLYEEFTHPAMCRKFGLALGLTDEDFDHALPVYGCLVHTAATVHAFYLASPVEVMANALSNETMVQRYAVEFDGYLRKHYDVSEEGMEFFVVHKGADVEHTERAAKAIAELASSDEDRERVRAVCRNMARLKLGKFDAIYDEYA
ncbi:MAG: iron-containing redox enzyme family protein [Chloroflexi bacterium]|nr:iron-containing redox enzyme family protein [Chloroflexota bacterium]